MMWWAVFCAAVAAGGAGAAAAPAPAPDSLSPLTPLDLVQIDPPAPDDESLGYMVPPMGGRSAPGAPWLYLLADVPRDSQVAHAEAARATGGVGMRARRGLSVNPAVEVLQRGAYHYYLERLAHNNRNFLNCVGKRGRERSGEAAHALAVHRPADVGAAPEAQPGEGEEDQRAAGRRQQELPQRHRETRIPVGSIVTVRKILLNKLVCHTPPSRHPSAPVGTTSAPVGTRHEY